MYQNKLKLDFFPSSKRTHDRIKKGITPFP